MASGESREEFEHDRFGLAGPCGHIIVCMDNSRRPCLREPGHKNGHNPFSDSDPTPEVKLDAETK